MIAHVDADSFFASVLVRQYPRLQGKPLLATGMGGGCVIAASYEAKYKGVKTGMRLTDALKLIPDAIHMPSDFREAGLGSQQIEKILNDHCPIIEQMSIDEWYLNLRSVVGGLPKDLDTWARKVQQHVLRQTALSVSIGVGPSKLLAKMAGEYRKPAGVTVLPGNSKLEFRNKSEFSNSEFQNCFELRISDFLRDRPAAAIPGIGRKLAPRVEARGWKTAWDIANAPTDELIRLCGRPGEEMQRELLGECVFPVTTEHDPPKSVSRARSFRRERDAKLLWAHLLRHAEYIVLKMRRHELACKGLSVWLRDTEYNHESAHASLPQPTATEEMLQPYLRRCLQKLIHPRQAYTQVGLALWHLVPMGALQYTLFDEPNDLCRQADLQKTLDGLHERYGRNAITRGSALKVKSGTTMGVELSVYD